MCISISSISAPYIMVLDAVEVKLYKRTATVIACQTAQEGLEESARRGEGLNAIGLETIFVTNFHDVLVRQFRELPLRECGQPTEKKVLSLGLGHLLYLHRGDGSDVLAALVNFPLEYSPRVVDKSTEPLPDFS